METKVCKKCNTLYNITEYHKYGNHSPVKYLAICKLCHNERVNNNRRKNPEILKRQHKKRKEKIAKLKIESPEKYNEIIDRRRFTGREWTRKNNERINKKRRGTRDPIKIKNNQLKRIYGITLEDFNIMIESQGNKCKICKNKFEKQFDVKTDHCHKTSKVRGLLCGKCNSALGLLKENITTLKNMIKYIKDNLPLQHKIKL